ncbi:hypothetical protein [Lichenicola sp.]|uniref:hypothetical protein n=1 Tax=Lichenicola sp. TaxID=2804529 RepID=UPI003B00161E
MAIAKQMVSEGQPDRVIAEALGGMNRMAVQRHRVGHMTGKVGVVAAQRQAAKGRMTALGTEASIPFEVGPYLSRDGIAADLDAIEQRLGIAAVSAAVDGRSAALAQLSAQQIRLMETRARLGEVGGYGRDRAGGAGGNVPFTFTIVFADHEGNEKIISAGSPTMIRDRDGREYVERITQIVETTATSGLRAQNRPPQTDMDVLRSGGPAKAFENCTWPSMSRLEP